jgi:hypothetical protein
VQLRLGKPKHLWLLEPCLTIIIVIKLTQGYILQFYHRIEAELPDDIRDDWIQWHHEELIRDNKAFETVQLKLDI